MTEPTDAEIESAWTEATGSGILPYPDDMLAFARAVLAKWGTPPAVAPWRSAVLDLIDDCPGLTMEQDQWLSRRVKELDFASTPQPTRAQTGAVPLTPEQIEAINTRTLGHQHFARAIEAEARAQALSEAYDLLFDVKGCKATRFDAQNAIRALAAPVDVQSWVELARARLGTNPPPGPNVPNPEA